MKINTDTIWNDKTVKPTEEQCADNRNAFIGWNGDIRYITYFDSYDGIFRIPVDQGGIPKMKPDDGLLKWAQFPNPPQN